MADGTAFRLAPVGMPIGAFLDTTASEAMSMLLASSAFDVRLSQREAWEAELEILRQSLDGVDGYIYLEFDVPRLGSRIDAVVVGGSVVVPIEFKVGALTYERADYNQAWDYALDLKNFHEASHGAAICPILVATEAPSGDAEWRSAHADGVRPPARSNRSDLRRLLHQALGDATGARIDGEAWGRAPYHPTPTISGGTRVVRTALGRGDFSQRRWSET
ncbi:MAG: hypothetical protein U0802_13935 [Candidatus Binatia bacterium]